jgi:hypothetical protein
LFTCSAVAISHGFDLLTSVTKIRAARIRGASTAAVPARRIHGIVMIFAATAG